MLLLLIVSSCKEEPIIWPIPPKSELVNVTVLTKYGSDTWSYQQVENIPLDSVFNMLKKGQFVNLKLSRGTDKTYKE
jgi:hypothetical protein